MKSIELHIAQCEESPNQLYWQLSNAGIKTSGVFECETRDDVARFTACAAHVFNAIKTFKRDKIEQLEDELYYTMCGISSCMLPKNHDGLHKVWQVEP